MKFYLPVFSLAGLPQRLKGMFNLNDPRWGRADDKPSDGTGNGPEPSDPPSAETPQRPTDERRPRSGANQGPPDLDELWRDFNRKLGGLFGNVKGGGRGGNTGGGRPGGFQPDMKNAGIGAGLVAAVVVLIWLGTGFFIVQEGQQAVITQFGKYHSTVGAGFNWRLPYPVQRHELIFVTQIRSVDVGRDTVIKATGLRESAMLTEDENIVEIKFAVQYRLSDARAFLFESKNPADAVVQAAETAVREVVGKMRMDSALSDERDQIAPRVRALMQKILDRYKVGIEIVGINLQQGGVRPPEQVQAAFDDVLKAGQERERAKNEAQAYANDVIPRAVGAASRLKEEADAYKARIVAQAQGDSQRFKSVLTEYQKAPQVTRDRMYIDTMQQIYGNVTKVLVDSRQGSNLLYMPLDKLIEMTGQSADAVVNMPTANGTPLNAPSASTDAATGIDARARDATRARTRETR
ncbi:MAG: FtsH protease activity modulator HflK [Rhodoferax sp.]|uniref:FtsH protease activity modulator HflK n=1 Tax=Rhodoferax sp. TaxID=50421 RepID=UPI001B65D785|nr:FtsH protease activity modulator HflK [Rhodoferax sp.]MBP9905542.1 FtsH protease activity modulator HflK [Rhodoferax sp.]